MDTNFAHADSIARGLRFMVSPDRMKADWVHPLEVPARCPDWIDVTHLNDDEFHEFMTAGEVSK